jgi:hypothetical protein
MAKHSGHDLARFFKRAGVSKVTPSEQIAAKHLFIEIAAQALDHRRGCHLMAINIVDNDTDLDDDTFVKVADRIAEAAQKVAETARRLNGHQPDSGGEDSKSD